MLDLAQSPSQSAKTTNMNQQHVPSGLFHNGKSLSVIYQNRIRRFKNTHLYKMHVSLHRMMELDKCYSTSLATIKGHLRTLRVKGHPDGPMTDFEARTIYQDIDHFL